ncbi:MAG TPA: ribose-5-phosphate isomerase RpiA [Polyangia bacterium]|nr:ribose-5-phosphate isomerase RpiA [Polyangia bacterium]
MHPRDRAAAAAVGHVLDGMLVGLGSGDTAARAIVRLGGRKIVGVATSEKSAALARSVGIEVRAPDEVAAIDLTIDGADEIDPALRLVKGGGGAHTREKLVARASREMIVVVDAAKRVARLGEHMRLPVEILPFAARWTLARLEALGLEPRVRDGFVTDNGNLIADCVLGPVGDLRALAETLKAMSGVVEHGLFLDEATLAYVGTDDGVERLSR